MTNRRNTIQKDLVRNAVYEMKEKELLLLIISKIVPINQTMPAIT